MIIVKKVKFVCFILPWPFRLSGGGSKEVCSQVVRFLSLIKKHLYHENRYDL